VLLNPQVLPLARHILEGKIDTQKIIDKIDRLISEKQSGVIDVNPKASVHFHMGGKKAFISGFIRDLGYHVNETSVTFEKSAWPVSMMLKWMQDIEARTMKASKLVDIPVLANRKIVDLSNPIDTEMAKRARGYRSAPADAGCTKFIFEAGHDEEREDWESVKNRILAVREDA